MIASTHNGAHAVTTNSMKGLSERAGNSNPGHKAKKAWVFQKLDSKCQNFETAQLLILPQQTLEKVAHGIMHSFACTNWFHFDLF